MYSELYKIEAITIIYTTFLSKKKASEHISNDRIFNGCATSQASWTCAIAHPCSCQFQTDENSIADFHINILLCSLQN